MRLKVLSDGLWVPPVHSRFALQCAELLWGTIVTIGNPLGFALREPHDRGRGACKANEAGLNWKDQSVVSFVMVADGSGNWSTWLTSP